MSLPLSQRQFSLRSLLLLTFAAAAWVSLFVPHVPLAPLSNWALLAVYYAAAPRKDTLFLHIGVPVAFGAMWFLMGLVTGAVALTTTGTLPSVNPHFLASLIELSCYVLFGTSLMSLPVVVFFRDLA